MDKAQWLVDLLADGPVPSRQAKAEGQLKGLSVSTIKRQASKLGVVVEDRGFPRATYWSLSEPTEPTAPQLVQLDRCECATTSVLFSGLCGSCHARHVEHSWLEFVG